MRDGSVADGLCKRIVSSSPRAVTPARWSVRPAWYAEKPTTSPSSAAPPESTFRLSARSIARLNAAAVTGAPDGGEKRKPGRTWNV